MRNAELSSVMLDFSFWTFSMTVGCFALLSMTNKD